MSLFGKKSLKRRLGAFILAAALALVPGAAFAATANPVTPTTTGAITVSGVQSGDVVKVYRVIETAYDATSNSITNTFAGTYGSLTVESYTALTDASDIASAVNTIAKEATKGTPTGTETATGESVTISNLPMGQYLVTVTPAPDANSGDKVYKNTTVNLIPEAASATAYKLDDATVTVKSQPLTITKKVGDTAGDRTEAYSKGDKVPFKVSVTVPEYPGNAINKLFEVGDKMDAGLQFNNDIVIKDANNGTVAPSNYAVSGDSNYTFKVAFDYDKIANLAGQTITLEYSATILDAAVPGTDQKNTATLEYANNPYDDNSHDKKTDDSKVGTFGIYLKKVNDEGTALEGAEFTVYRAAKTGETGATVTGITGSVVEVDKITTGTDGMGSIKGLGEGTYYIKETKAPAGYVVSNTVITKVVNADEAQSDKTKDWYRYVNAGEITNKPQPTLPITGGPGTMALTGLGVALIAGGAAMFARSRKEA